VAVRLPYQKYTKFLGTKKISEHRQRRERKAAAGKEYITVGSTHTETLFIEEVLNP
jgi:hypothetical protein